MKNYIDKLFFRFNKNKLDEIYGVYNKQKIKKINLLLNMGRFEEILPLNKSTQDRLPYYLQFFKKIFAITGKPNSIIDLACGLNPLAFPFMGLEKINYLAMDISPDSVRVVNQYFKKNRIKGKAKIIDLRKAIDLRKNIFLVKADICFLFEFIDLVGLAVDKKMFESINCPWIVVTFPRTIKQDDLRFQRKIDFEDSFDKIIFRSFLLGKEKVYILNKNLYKQTTILA